MTYQEYIQSDEWRVKAEDAKRRAGYHCQVCNSPIRLDAHHRTYDHLGEELPEDITVMCHECHVIFTEHHRLPQWLLPQFDYEPIPFDQLLTRKMQELGIS